MKSKIVLWGANAQDEKILIGIALRAEENKVDIWTFPESVATEEFYQQMMKEWRDDSPTFELPETHTHLERELTMSESLLPDDLKAERTDILQRAQTEWHFIVLSSKLHHVYESELNELKERVEKLENFDQSTWDSLKEFWDKLQNQVQERNIFREHADTLRDNTNALFGKMKELRSQMDAEFDKISKEAHDMLMNALQEIEAKAKEGGRLAGLFDELKKIQRKFRETDLTREHRGKVWDKLNAAFKEVKERRFGAKADDGSSHYQRLKRRYDGLISAIGKMEQSIGRDKEDLEFQHHKVETTSGQLEAQIRQAKIVMIEERIRSKEEKLGEMKATQVELEGRLESQKEREVRREAKEHVKEKIAEEIKAAAEARENESEKLEKAAEEIASSKAPAETGAKKAIKEETIADALSATLGDSLEDVVDTIKAVAAVISDKVEDAIEELKEEFAKPEAGQAPEADDEEELVEAETPVGGEAEDEK